MKRGSTRGFSLPELLVAIVIGAFLLMATYQVLGTQQRVSSVQSEQVRLQQTIRAGLDLLSQELREVSLAGDLLAMDPTSVTVRTMRSFGVACAVESTVPPRLRVWVQGRRFEEGDQVFVFADGDPTTMADDQWIPATVLTVGGEGLTCGSAGNARPAQRVTFSGTEITTGVLLVRTGATVRAFETVTYELAQVDGETFLVRVQGGDAVPLVGPVAPNDGVEFAYLDGAGVETALPGNVRQIRVSIRAVSAARGLLSGDPLSETLASTIFLRN